MSMVKHCAPEQFVWYRIGPAATGLCVDSDRDDDESAATAAALVVSSLDPPPTRNSPPRRTISAPPPTSTGTNHLGRPDDGATSDTGCSSAASASSSTRICRMASSTAAAFGVSVVHLFALSGGCQPNVCASS